MELSKENLKEILGTNSEYYEQSVYAVIKNLSSTEYFPSLGKYSVKRNRELLLSADSY